MYARTRDIEDGRGVCIRISVSPHPSGAIVSLERRDQLHRPSVLLSLSGTEILNGFIMAARLTSPHAMPDETTGSPFSARFYLEAHPIARVVIEQDDNFPLSIDARLWDRLYAELCLVIAHGRAFALQAQYHAQASLN